MAREFAKLARQARLQARVTLREVAEALGMSVAYVSEVERGNRPTPSMQRAELWARAVKTDPETLVRAACADLEMVELTVDHLPQHQREVALALGRAYDGLSEEQARRILEILGVRE